MRQATVCQLCPGFGRTSARCLSALLRLGQPAFAFAAVLAMLAALSIAATAAQNSRNSSFSLVERAAGPVRTVAVRGHFAYAGVGHKLLVFDVSVPAKPKLVNEGAALPQDVKGLAVTERNLYAATGTAGLHIYDIGSPESPILLGSLVLPGIAQAVAVARRHAYVAAGPAGLRIVDISDPAAPIEVGSYDKPGLAMLDVDVENSYAYVTTDPSGLHVIDVTNPAAPIEIGSKLVRGAARGIMTAPPFAYIAAGKAGLRIIDISAPQAPIEIGSSAKSGPEDAYDVEIAGVRAYVADRNVSDGDERFDPGGLRIVDISTPSAPVELGDLKGDVWSVDVRRRLAYVASGDRGRFNETGSLDVIAIEDPTRLRRLASVAIPPRINDPVAASGSDLFAIDDHLYRFDLADPEQPHLAWSLRLPTDTYYRGRLTGLAIAGGHAFIGGGTAGLHVVSLADPDRPRLLATLPIEAYDIAADGEFVFASELFGGLSIVSIADPKNPQVVGTIAGSWSAEDMVASGGYLYVCPYPGSALLIYRIKRPAEPVLIATLALSDTARHIAIADGYAYLAVGSVAGKLVIADISRPAKPKSVGELAIAPFPISAMANLGNTLYLTLPIIPGGGLRAVDVSDPTDPRLSGEYVMSTEFATAVAHMADDIVAVGGSQGLLILKETAAP